MFSRNLLYEKHQNIRIFFFLMIIIISKIYSVSLVRFELMFVDIKKIVLIRVNLVFTTLFY